MLLGTAVAAPNPEGIAAFRFSTSLRTERPGRSRSYDHAPCGESGMAFGFCAGQPASAKTLRNKRCELLSCPLSHFPSYGLSDTKVESRILPTYEPANYFLGSPFGDYVYDEKIYPGRPGHAEEIFFKNNCQNPRIGLKVEAAAYAHSKGTGGRPCRLQNTALQT